MQPLLANWSYVHVFKDIILALKEAAVTDDKVNTMMVDNPRRLFAGEWSMWHESGGLVFSQLLVLLHALASVGGYGQLAQTAVPGFGCHR
jgi:hypothetical protein